MPLLVIPDSTSVTITKVTMDGCDQDFDDSCVAKRGAKVTGQLFFTVTQPIESLTCSIYAHVGPAWIPFPGGCPTVDGCTSLSNGQCPLKVGDTAVYNINMEVPSFSPAVSITTSLLLPSMFGKKNSNNCCPL